MKDIIIQKQGWILKENNRTMKFNHKLNLNTIHNQLNNIKYDEFYINDYKNKNMILENYKIPPMVYEFYRYLCVTGKIPDLQELTEIYLKKYCIALDNEEFQLKEEYINKVQITFKKSDLIGRICRAYNSYNREVEFLCNLISFCEKNKYKIEFNYSFIEDYYNGLDIIAIHNNNKYGICLYMDSKNSHLYKKMKNNDRHHYSKNTIDVISYHSGENKNTYKLGDIYLYNDITVKNTIRKILKEEN